MTGKLRIVAGEFKGRLISCPQASARPTTDRVREALFSSLLSLEGSLEGISVCDAFAGSGALGFEALSRGAASVQFFDVDQEAMKCVKGNAALLGASASTAIGCRDVLKAGISGSKAPYDLLFLDPPYATSAEDVLSLLRRAGHEGALADGCLIVYERDASAPGLSDAAAFPFAKEKRYGKSAVDLLRCDPAAL